MVINMLKESKLIDTDITSKSDCDLSSGSFVEEGYMSFQVGEDTIDIDLVVNVYGYEDYDEGDYWTAPYVSTEIDSIEIEIREVYLNGDEIEVSDDFKIELEKLAELNL